MAWAALALAAAWMGFAGAGPASARPVELGQAVCVGGADSVKKAFAIDPAALDCRSGRVPRDRFLRGRVELARVGLLPPGSLIWQTDPTSFESMLIRLDYADGTQRLIDVDAQMAVRNWDANGNFWVPIQQGSSPLSAIDVVVERPHSGAIFSRMTLSGFGEASARNYGRTLLYVLICGTLLVPIIYDLFFYRVLRARFMLWHLVMTVSTLAYVLLNSGLIMVVVPDIPSHLRFASIYVAMSLASLGMARFAVLVLEEGKVPRRVSDLVTGSAIANLAISLLLVADLEALRIRLVDLYLVSVLPLMVGLVAVLASALARGSRAAVFLAVAFAGLIVTGAAQVLASLGLFGRSEVLDEGLYFALVLLIVGTSAGVGDRFLVIKTQRDRAWLTARKLGAMANSDGLTGLLNRRAFDQTRRLGNGRALLLADIDRFKSINDTYGHQRGDAVLCHAARVIEEEVDAHGGGEVYRLGGEEFAVLTPPVTETGMMALAEDIRAAIEQCAEREDAYDMPDITISIGAVMGQGQLMHVAFSEADGALYRAKEAGRNRCEVARAEES